MADAVVNCARGGIVCESALLEGLKQKQCVCMPISVWIVLRACMPHACVWRNACRVRACVRACVLDGC